MALLNRCGLILLAVYYMWFVVLVNAQTVQLQSVEGMKVVSQEFEAIILLGGSLGVGKTFSTRPWKVFWTFWFTDKLIKTGYSGVFIAGQKQMFEMIDADIGHLI
ncbi:hypothetical protein Tco_0642621 [Tanacetum coccineum]